jgi:hypothetical protein
MGLAKNIQLFPIKPSVFITVFRATTRDNFKISSSLRGTVCNGNAICTNFNNKRLTYPNHQMIGHLGKDIFEKRLQKFFLEINFEYTQKTASEALIDYLRTQNYPTEDIKYSITTETIWVIIPKPYKSPKGDKFTNIFTNIPKPGFLRGESHDLELTVWMTPITPHVKSISFRVDIPDYIYDKCMEDPDIDARPGTKYIESDLLSILHTKIQEYGNQAFYIEERRRNSEKCIKKLAIIFSSSEHAERDNFNFAYMGQKISTVFQWYTVYEYQDGWGSRKYFSWKRKNNINLSGVSTMPSEDSITDFEAQGKKMHFHTTPPGIILDWTQDREDFLSALEENFRKLSGNLNEFLRDLNSEKLDRLIATSALKLLGTDK